ncbi:hypothetical protein ACIOGZ_00030 [Kitasatospora sp. NPDC088160]|uniref:hypothetical protein n=1 Tax=Kitasatospora sp. NPDC088160 TaxID=3364072 RepID=UPI00381FA71B
MAAAVAAGALMGVLAGCSSGSTGSSPAGSDAAKGAAGAASAVASATGPAGGESGAGASVSASASASASAAATGAGAASAPATGGGGAGASAPPAGAATPGADLEAVLLDDKLVGQVLPDAKAMAGWEEEKRKVDTIDHATTCTASVPCTGKPLSGSVRFSSGDLVARFIVETLPNRDAAKGKLKESYASYGAGPFRKVDSPVLGSESQVFQGQLGEGEGIGIVLRSGTVVASVTTEGGPADVAAARRFGAMLVKRIEQAQAGRTPDAGLGLA